MPDLAQLEHEAKQQLTGLTLVLAGARTLLVPSAALAELVTWQPPESLPGGVRHEDGLIGRINWRGRQLPLLSFEVLAGEDEPDVTQASRIAIFNSLDPSAGLEFYAVLLQGIPRTVLVDSRLHPDQDADLRIGELTAVQLDGECLIIPDLDAVEHRLIRARLQQRF